MPDTHKCPGCGADVPDEREEITGTPYCIQCTPQPKQRLMGVMEFSHKTAGVLIITDDLGFFKQLKKPANRRR